MCQKDFSDIFYRVCLRMTAIIVLNDSLIIWFGERKFNATSVKRYTSGLISSGIREPGHLLKLVRQKADVAVSTLTQALALRLGHSFQKSVSVLKAKAIKSEDS